MNRTWIRAGNDPLRYEYVRETDRPTGLPIKDHLAHA